MNVLTSIRGFGHTATTAIKKHVIASVAIAVVAVAGLAGGVVLLASHSSPSASSNSTATIPTLSPGHGTTKKKGKPGLGAAALLKIEETTTGLSASTVQADLTAGQTLAQIAGSKEQAVIDAANAALAKSADAAVAAGTMTQAQATKLEDKAKTQIATLMAMPGPQLLALTQPKAKASPTPSPAVQ